MEMQQKNRISDSFNNSVKALNSALASAYKLAPFAVILLTLMSVFVVWLTIQWTPLMTGSAVILVLILSLSIFAVRGNFGEALLSLIGGLLSIFAYEWTQERYIAFSIAWIGFALFAFLISSIKLGAKSEDIYRHAAIKLAGSGPRLKVTEKRLKDIGAQKNMGMLGPIERAETIRTFAFRNLSIELFSSGLAATETLSVITKCDIHTVSVFIADFFGSFQPKNDAEAHRITDILYHSIRSTPVSPEEYFAAFEKSRRLIVSQMIEPRVFLNELQVCLSHGVPLEDVYNVIRVKYESGSQKKMG